MTPGTGNDVTASVIVPLRVAGAGVSAKSRVYVTSSGPVGAVTVAVPSVYPVAEATSEYDTVPP